MSLQSLVADQIPVEPSNSDEPHNRDPVSVLPVEILDQIFGLIPFSTLIQCRIVSRSWKGYVENRSHLWRKQLDFSKTSLSLSWKRLDLYRKLGKFDDSPGNRIKMLTVRSSKPDQPIFDTSIAKYLRRNQALFEELDISSHHPGLGKVFFESNTSQLRFPHLHTLKIETVLKVKYMVSLLVMIPTLQELDYCIYAEEAGLQDEIYPVTNSKKNRVSNITRRRKKCGLKSLKFKLQGDPTKRSSCLWAINSVLESCVQLETLEILLWNRSLEPETLRHKFSSILRTRLPLLKSVHLEPSSIGRSNHLVIGSPNLRQVRLDAFRSDQFNQGSRAIESSQVQELSLQVLKSRDFFRLSSILDPSSLISLDLSNSKISDSLAASQFTIFMQGFDQLKCLSLYGSVYLHDATVVSLSRVCRNLLILDLGHTKVSDSGIVASINAGVKILGVKDLDYSSELSAWAQNKTSLKTVKLDMNKYYNMYSH